MHDHHSGDDCGCDSTLTPTDDNTEETLTCISEFVSRNENYKAAVYDLHADPVKYEVAIYKWQEVKDDSPVWEREAGPVIMDTVAAAETWGQQNLAIYAGEKLDDTVNEPLRSEVFAALGHEDFDFLSPHGYQVSFLESEDSEDFLAIPQVDKVLAAGEFYFVEFQGAWLAGFLYDEAEIRCWKKFEDLKSALLEIVV